jgi:hypothetical protein
MLRVFFLIFILSNIIFASVQTYISSEQVNFGESITLKIEASGQNIEFEDIYEICKSNIESSSNSQSISIINGKTSKKIAKTYVFTPQNNCTIQSLNIKVDGKTEKTKPIKIKVNTNIQQTKNDNFSLEIIANKKEVYLYEPIEITIKLKRKENKEVLDIKLGDINFESFWIKENKKEKAYKENGYIVNELYYKIYPQKTGHITINPTSVNIAIPKQGYDPFGFISRSASWKRIYSNKIDLNIKDIPKGVSLVGDFDIKTTIDKTNTNANEPVNLKLIITGNGNFDDIKQYNINIKDTNIYSDKPIVKNNNFTQTFAIVANSDYEIPSMQIKYFSPKSKKVIIKKTKPIKISVKNAINEKPIIQKAKTNTAKIKNNEKIIINEKISNKDKLLYFIIGILFTIIIIAIYLLVNKSIKNKKLSEYFNLFTNDNDKLNLLIPHFGKNKEIDELIKKLEENIYENKNHKVVFSKEIKEFLK